ncbi:Peptidoglycan L-alanyl-D-glutamate endopeptidase CwlK precursor [compost metagenome]
MATLEQTLAKSVDIFNNKNLDPGVAYAARKLVERCYKEGVEIRLTFGYRSIEEQNELYAQGRTKPGKIVTNAKGGRSYHNHGLAIDFVLIKGGYDMTADNDMDGFSDWMEVVAQAKLLGFEWGGDWTNFVDYPHFQIIYGLSISDLQSGKRPTAAQANAIIYKIIQIEKRDDEMNELEVLRNKVELLDARATAIEKRLNLFGKENYASDYKEAVEAAKTVGLISTVQDKSKIELNTIQMLHNAGLTNPNVVKLLKETAGTKEEKKK